MTPGAFIPEKCSGYDLAVILGISPRAVRDWAARGVLIRASEQGRYLTLESIHNYLDRLRDGQDMLLPASRLDVEERQERKIGGSRKSKGMKK